MTRMIPRLLLSGSLMCPFALNALGLGEIHLSSALNQPFDAQIELLSPSSEELQSLKVSLAPNDIFERYGVDRPAFLSNLKFRVVRTGEGRNVIRIVSTESITEPFVTLIVEAAWARGRLLREYTVLLDPPVFLPREPAPAAVTTPVAGSTAGAQAIERPAAAPAPRPAVAPAPAPEPEPVVEPAAVYTGGTYQVRRNDTLWKIASELRPGSARVVNQTMIAIFRANPEAFDGNINRLRAGAVLRLPDESALESVSQAEATAEVARQYQVWRGPAVAAEEGARLRLVAPGQAVPSAEAPGAAEAAARAETEAPVGAVPGAEPAAETPERLLEVRDAELAEMQRQLSEAEAEGVAEAPPTEAPVSEEPAAVPQPTEAVEPSVAEPVESPPAEAAAPAKTPAVPAVRPRPAPTPSLLERLEQYWWVLIVAGLAVLAALLLYVRKRREPDLEAAIETLTPLDFAGGERTATRPTVTRRRKDEDFLVEEQAASATTAELQAPQLATRTAVGRSAKAAGAIGAAAASAAAAARPVSHEPAVEETISSDTAVHLDQADPLAEADFHMAYGLYDQAADLVKIAIDREPARRDLRLKLLEIFFVWGNKDRFLETARELADTRAQAAPGEWEKILIMGKQICPEESLFAGEVDVAHAGDLVDLNLEGGESRVDIELFGEPAAEGGAGLDFDFGADTESTMEGVAQGEAGIDFLLDEPQRGVDEELAREIDSTARTQEVAAHLDLGAHTQEVPTIESPTLDSLASQTIREKIRFEDFEEEAASPEQTAELALDDLGLDVDATAATGEREIDLSAEFAAEEDTGFELADTQRNRALEQAAEAAGADQSVEIQFTSAGEDTGTARLESANVDFEETGEQPRPDMSTTAMMSLGAEELQALEEALPAADEEAAEDTGVLDFDVGEAEFAAEGESSITRGLSSSEIELPELEPVTMSEVGTKLDLARAYVDMGDPDGARSILEEVLHEGSVTQRDEAQRLLEAIR